MSNDRDKIFSSIKSALAPLPERAAYPEWDDALPISRGLVEGVPLKEQFAQKLIATSGRFCESVEQLVDLLTSEESTFGYCDPELAYLLEGNDRIQFETEYDLAKVDAYTFGITKASAAIAESGTIMLTDAESSTRLGALTPWIHIAVIKEADIVPTVLSAVERFGDDPSIIFCTGPSKTADVEGILIEGVHGPGVQVALLV